MFEQKVFSDSTNDPAFDAMNSCEDLTQRVRNGDENAFTELVREFHTPLCTYLARLVGNDELGRDLAQETLIRAWTSLPTLRDEQHFKAWLYRIATNLAHSHLRRARLISWLPWTEASERSSQGALSIAGPEEHVGESDMIRKTLAHLSPQYRTCLLLQSVAGFSQRDIASLLGISEKSVGSNVCRARDQFRSIYASLKETPNENASIKNVTACLHTMGCAVGCAASRRSGARRTGIFAEPHKRLSRLRGSIRRVPGS